MVIDKIYFKLSGMGSRRVQAVQSPIRRGEFLDRSVQRWECTIFSGRTCFLFYLNADLDDQLIDETEIRIIRLPSQPPSRQSGPGAGSAGTMIVVTANGTGYVINGSVAATNGELVPGAVRDVRQSNPALVVSGTSNGQDRSGTGGAHNLTNGINGTNGSSSGAGDHGTRNRLNGTNGIDSLGGSPALTNGNNVTNGSNRTNGINGTGSHHDLTIGTHGTNADDH